jgi:hypothetical protein
MNRISNKERQAMKIKFVVVLAAAIGLWCGVAALAPSGKLQFIGEALAGSCDIDDNLSDSVETFFGRCCKGSGRSVMPGNMWSKSLRDVKDNRSKDDDYKTCWKLISRSEYRK